MTDPFDVTVIVPTYEGGRYLHACLESIAANELDGVEVLVVDDSSTDDTVAIAESFAGRIADLRVIRNPERLGAVGNVNRCIELARGRWIKPVFQDDLIDPTCLTEMRAARLPGVPVVVCGRRYLFEGDVPSFRREACDHLVEHSLPTRFGDGLLSRDALANVLVDQAANGYPQVNIIGEPVVALFDRHHIRKVGGIDDGFVQLWDYELVLRFAMTAGVVLVDRPLATFRVHEESETARNFAQQAFRSNVLDRLRLHVLYAAGRRFAPVRRAAAGREPPVDLRAVAVGVARAARRLRDGLPAEVRDDATGRLDALCVHLPDPPHGPPGAQADAMEALVVEELAAGPWLSLSDQHVEMVGDAPAPEAPAAPEAATAPEVVAASEPSAAPEIAAATDEPAPARSRVGALAKITRAAGALRTNQWWGHMLGPIVAFACLQIGWRSVAPGVGMGRAVALLVCTIGLACYGYVVNDASDIEADRIAGKTNSMAGRSTAVRAAIILVCAFVGALPWLIVPLPRLALAPLLGGYLVPILYSVRPFRFKERDLLGPIADASNAFVLPSLFTMALYAPLGDPAGPAWLMVVGGVLWTAAFGLRAIVKHQIDDAENDRATGTRTLVLRVGVARAHREMGRVLFPIEIVGLVLLIATVALWSWGTVVLCVGAFAAFQALRLRGIITQRVATVPLSWGGWMYWQQIWPALIVSVALWVSSPWFVLLTAGVVVLFWPRVRNGVRNLVQTSSNEVRRLRAQRS
jgi:GT2 family glycosyltransferase/4-hydroxybenzoate polyprenyltransferase